MRQFEQGAKEKRPTLRAGRQAADAIHDGAPEDTTAAAIAADCMGGHVMTIEAIQRQFQASVADTVELASEGLCRYRVFTPFRLEDGDHLAIVLRKQGDRWQLSDEGTTLMRLTYDLKERDIQQGPRNTIIQTALGSFGLIDHDGELVLDVPEGRYGDALYSFVQALLRVSSVSLWSRERMVSTFLADFRGLITALVPADRRTFDWTDPQHDVKGHYPVDCRVNGLARPLYLFAIPSNDKARDVTVFLHQYENWSLRYRAVGCSRTSKKSTGACWRALRTFATRVFPA